MIHEEICTYELCKLAKEKGFGEMASCYQGYRKDGTLFYFSNMPDGKERVMQTDCLAPTQSLLQRWLREEKKVHIEIAHNPMYGGFMPYICKIVEGEEGVFTLLEKNSHCIAMRNATYENALEAGLKYALKNLIL